MDFTLSGQHKSIDESVRRICADFSDDYSSRCAVDSNAVFIDDLFIPDEDRIRDEGRGFEYILSFIAEKVLDLPKSY